MDKSVSEGLWQEWVVVGLFRDALFAIHGRSTAASMPPTVTEETHHHPLH